MTGRKIVNANYFHGVIISSSVIQRYSLSWMM